MSRRTLLLTTSVIALSFGPGCSNEESVQLSPGDFTKPSEGKWDTSVEAIFLDFEFDGQVTASSGFNAQSKIQDQLLYTIGQLNGVITSPLIFSTSYLKHMTE